MFIKQFKQISNLTTILLCLGLLCAFQGSFDAREGLGKSIAKNFADETSDSNPSEENSESQDLVLNHEGNYSILKVSAKNSGFANHLPISGFTLSIATPPPDFLS